MVSQSFNAGGLTQRQIVPIRQMHLEANQILWPGVDPFKKGFDVAPCLLDLPFSIGNDLSGAARANDPRRINQGHTRRNLNRVVIKAVRGIKRFGIKLAQRHRAVFSCRGSLAVFVPLD